MARPQVQREARRLMERLARLGSPVQIEEQLALEMGRRGVPLGTLARWSDLLVALGGDGTALRGARALAGKRGALLAVNMGGLGFLTAAEAAELEEAVRSALDGSWRTARRRLLQVSVERARRVERRGRAMNDAVVKAAGGYSALHLRLHALGSDLGHLVADGVIAATPWGSTAYSLSAGGPVLSQELGGMVVTPVCPHALGSRPLVLSGTEELSIDVLGSFDQASLMLDGQDRFDLEPRDRVTLGMSRVAVRVFVNPKRPLAHTLREKLGWQGSERRSLI